MDQLFKFSKPPDLNPMLGDAIVCWIWLPRSLGVCKVISESEKGKLGVENYFLMHLI